MNKFCVVEEKTGDTWRVCDTLVSASATADILRIGTGQEFAVLEVKPVYSTNGAEYVLSPACISLKESWDKFRAVRDRLVTRRG